MKSNERVLRAMIREMINEDRPKIELVRVPSVGDTYRPVALPGKIIKSIAAYSLVNKGFNFLNTGCVSFSNFPVSNMMKLIDSEDLTDIDVLDAAIKDVEGLTGRALGRDGIYTLIKYFFGSDKWPADKEDFAQLDQTTQARVKDLLKATIGKKCLLFDVDVAIKSITDAGPFTRDKFKEEMLRFIDEQHELFQTVINDLQNRALDVDLSTIMGDENQKYQQTRDACR